MKKLLLLPFLLLANLYFSQFSGAQHATMRATQAAQRASSPTPSLWKSDKQKIKENTKTIAYFEKQNNKIDEKISAIESDQSKKNLQKKLDKLKSQKLLNETMIRQLIQENKTLETKIANKEKQKEQRKVERQKE